MGAKAFASLARTLWVAVRWLGSHLPLWLDHARPVRIPLLVLAIAVFVAVGVDQASELFLIAVWVDPNNWRFLALLCSSALTGLTIWYAARNAYRLNYPRWPALQDESGAGLREWTPRVLGALVPALVLLGYLLALFKVPHVPCTATGDCIRRDWRASLLLVESVLMVLFFIVRRPMLHALQKNTTVAKRPAEEVRVARVRDLGKTPLRLSLLAVACNLIALVLIAWWPELLDGIGPLAILLIASAFLCFSGGFLCMIVDRRGWPLLTTLLLLSAALHALHLNDNHLVRQYPHMSTHQTPDVPPPDLRPHFADYANAWLSDRCPGHDPCPVVLVSAEGGGIRGAAWTALVLSRLTALIDAEHPAGQAEPLLGRYLFAGSGVSGGSLGLATYVTMLRHASTAASLEADSQRLLSHDYLAPTLANMMFVDFTQRWLPGAWFNDRSRALTRAWERAAKAQHVDDFSESFSAMYMDANGQPNTRTPALFLNSTTVAEGRRFIQHPFYPMASPQAQPWTAAFDGSAWLDPRVPLSEVVLNSARFTYVSPAGTLQSTAPNAPLPSRLQLVDGGYFENSGTTTLLEVMRQLRAVAKQRAIALRFIVLHISNDPDMSDFIDQHDKSRFQPWFSTACPASEPTPKDNESGEATAPLLALLDTRGARGEYARVQLKNALHASDSDPAAGDMLWHFRLCHGNYPIPLGWTISTPVFGEMDRQLEQNYPLQAMAHALGEQLSAPAQP
ncbi:hypothetical protein [Dyella sp. GSA-30]|uniref:hypothetical protein n=1 Tax=Dyella sp. GSA-30 TaxID=2994496 RepID=UPI00248FDA51|nr:hypothetical protein [Dyella sp. GSA-30]BDU19344.1 hypothetical protein DYGSA30_08010 [Dyella sp. GSA-30]